MIWTPLYPKYIETFLDKAKFGRCGGGAMATVVLNIVANNSVIYCTILFI
jgi:hypothetical protein